MLVKIEALILIFPGTDFHFPSTPVPPGTFIGSDATSLDSETQLSGRHLRRLDRRSAIMLVGFPLPLHPCFPSVCMTLGFGSASNKTLTRPYIAAPLTWAYVYSILELSIVFAVYTIR